MSAFAQRIADLAPHFSVSLPDGPGPHPTVLQFHGCGGVKPYQARYAEAARAAGWAAVVVDSYAHRGISTLNAYASVCTGLRLWGRERAGDLYAAMEWVRRQDWADPARIGVAGWSHGGWTVLDALAMDPAQARRATRLGDLPDDLLGGLRAAFLVYPYCGAASIRRAWRTEAKGAAIIAGRDSVVGAKAPMRALSDLRARGAALDVELFETATHAFDEHEARDARVRHDPALTARAMDSYRTLLGSV